MEIKTLYRYLRPDGGVTVSLVKPDGEYTETFRVVAGEGKEITLDGVSRYYCIDTDETSGWYEVEEEPEE